MNNLFAQLRCSGNGKLIAVLALRLLLVFLMYSLVRCAFFVYNRDLLGMETWGQLANALRGGLLFDASAIAYTNALVILLHILPMRARHSVGYQRAIGWVYWLSNVPMFVFNLADVVYVRFTGRRTTLDVLEEFSNENPFNFLSFFLSYWGVTLFGLICIALWVWLYRRIRVVSLLRTEATKRYYLASILSMVLIAWLTVAAMRGGFTAATRPIAAANAVAFVDKVQQRELVLNTPFVLIRFIGKAPLPEYRYMSNDEARQIFDPIYRAGEHPSPHAATLQGRNVVLIIWESMAREWVGALNRDIEGYEGYTPFIDSLIQHSYCFENAYAGGLKSIDAMPNLLASLPKPGVPFVVSLYSGNELGSIVRVLSEEEGYTSAYFHNADNGLMGFDAMAKQLGFQHYYGKNEFGDDREHDGRWGIWDEPFLQFFGRTISTLKEPFFVTEFTTTSHHPFNIPSKYRDVFLEGPMPIHKCIRYTDYAIKRFFDYARTQPWYMNTLFVITADHAVAGALPEYADVRGIYRIPMIFFDPQGELVGRSLEAVQQADLMPTLLDLMGLERPMVAFGKSMFMTEGKHWAVSAINSGYQLVMGDLLMQYDGANVLAVYNLKDDPRLTKNIKNEPLPEITEMLRFLKAYLQQYSERMRHNRLVVSD
ncbi:MAG: sulfatase-like hydrolase/transferase [Porphyromonadaceae bacterium]|nr:sulfatase-like hydrolase/transferase [Porphyromonadaceae bacterium]